MPEKFDLTEVGATGSAVVIRVKGHLDVKSTPRLIERAKKVRAQGRSLILNLSEVSFIASNGIGGLLAMVEDFKRDGLNIRLAELSVAVESVLKLLNLDQFLEIDTTENAALAELEV
jgi:anti-anti-sigma factor